jgi:hypothetical protein
LDELERHLQTQNPASYHLATVHIEIAL